MESKHKSDYGKFVLSAGKFHGDAEKDMGNFSFLYCSKLFVYSSRNNGLSVLVGGCVLTGVLNMHARVWICYPFSICLMSVRFNCLLLKP